jgi:hypothetical protein
MSDESPHNEELQRVALTMGEIQYVRSLEERNQVLTLALGDEVIRMEQIKKSLEEHRMTLIDAYVTILKMHGVPQGKVNAAQGVIEVIS